MSSWATRTTRPAIGRISVEWESNMHGRHLLIVALLINAMAMYKVREGEAPAEPGATGFCCVHGSAGASPSQIFPLLQQSSMVAALPAQQLAAKATRVAK